MVIDVHAHIIIPEITRQSAPDEAWRPVVSWEDGKQIIDFAGKRIRSAVREFVHIDSILEEQLAAGIDRVLLCPWVSLLRYHAKPDEGLRTSRIQNEGLAKLARAYPDRVSVLGTVPLQEPKMAARELEELMKQTGLCGVEIAASVRGAYLGDERFFPFWDAAEANKALVFIHPTTRGFNLGVFERYYLWNTVGNPLETTITAAHMIMAGVMETHPNLKVLLAHAGGAILSLRGRMRHAYGFQEHARSRLKESPERSLKRFYFDTLTHDTDLLHALVDYVGSAQVLVGSDYPFDMGLDRPAEIVRGLGLPRDEELMILSGNAAQLLGLEA